MGDKTEIEQYLLRIPELADALGAATQAYEKASQEAASARSAKTAALNKLNDAQKALDTALEEMKKASPRDSDWRAEEQRMGCIPEKAKADA